MPVLQVVQIGDKVLSSVTKPIEVVLDRHRELAENMIETMYDSPGSVGIAAPQVGVSESLFVLDVSGHKKTNICHGLLVVLNPIILSASDPVTLREGCMSVPHLTGDVKRPSKLVMTGMSLDGAKILIETDAFEARALLHEIDHLNGKLFLDRVDGPHAVFKRKRYL